MAARWILIPTFLVALLLLVFGALAMREVQRAIATAEKSMEEAVEKNPPAIMRMQHKKDYLKTVGKSELKPVIDGPAPDIVKLQKPGREMK